MREPRHRSPTSPTVSVHMSDEYDLTLQQADQARADFAAIDDSLNLIMRMLVPMPTAQRGLPNRAAWRADRGRTGREAEIAVWLDESSEPHRTI
jgi:hypothetical protein